LRDRVVILRINGQVETFYLHEINPLQHVVDVASAVTSIADNKFKIDVEKFKQKVVNLGGLLDNFNMVPFVGSDGKVIGIVVTDKDPKSLAFALGFKENDLILAIDNTFLTTHKDRMLAYDKIIAKKEDAEFYIEFERDGQRLKNCYILSSKQEKPLATVVPVVTENKKQELASSSQAKSPVKFTELMSADEKKATNALYKDNIDRIRQEMLANLQLRTN